VSLSLSRLVVVVTGVFFARVALPVGVSICLFKGVRRRDERRKACCPTGVLVSVHVSTIQNYAPAH
jgi:hypothetical protein